MCHCVAIDRHTRHPVMCVFMFWHCIFYKVLELIQLRNRSKTFMDTNMVINILQIYLVLSTENSIFLFHRNSSSQSPTNCFEATGHSGCLNVHIPYRFEDWRKCLQCYFANRDYWVIFSIVSMCCWQNRMKIIVLFVVTYLGLLIGTMGSYFAVISMYCLQNCLNIFWYP